jgi:hypothetical protein
MLLAFFNQVISMYISTDLDPIGNEAESGSDPQEHGKARKEILAELDPFWCRFGWGQAIFSVLFNIESRLLLGQSLFDVGAESLAQLINRNFVDI